jgi:hypothetical protein
MKAKLLFLALIISIQTLSSQTALNFDGVNDFVLGTNNTSLNLNQGTIEAWIKTDNAGSDWRAIINKQEAYSIYLHNNNLSIWDMGNWQPIYTTVNLADNTWHHIAYSFEHNITNGSKLYVDGIAILTRTISVPNSTNKIIVGASSSSSNYIQHFKGDIDQVRVWNTVRTDAEILNTYNKCLTGTENGLVMLWQFEEGAGLTVTDISGNGNNGTLQNMTDANWVSGYSCEPIELIAYYPFNGNANDESGNGNHGTVNGATLTTDRFGNANSAYSFDGINDYIQCLQPGPLGTTPRTISFWAKTDFVPNGSYANAALSYGNLTASGGRFEIGLNSKVYGLALDVVNGEITKTFDNSDNEWHLYTIVYEGSTSPTLGEVKFYADGELLTIIGNETGASRVINTKNQYPLTIGKLIGNTRYFKGAIDEIKIYNTAHSLEDIKNEYQGLVAYYPFNGNANDESGNNHHGTVYGASLTQDRNGNTDNAYSFDGINNYIDLGDWENGGEMSFTFWARWDTTNNWSRIIDIGNGTRNEDIMISNYYNENNIAFYVNQGPTQNFKMLYTTSSPITLGQWGFYSATVNNDGLMRIYKNGVLINELVTGYTPNKLIRTEQYLGRSLYPGDKYFKGAIDELRIYQSVLSEAQLLNLYNFNTLKIEKFDTATESPFYVNNNTLYFKNTQNLQEIKTVEVYNILGQKVFKTSKIEEEISFKTLPIGVYILKVNTINSNSQTLRFLSN